VNKEPLLNVSAFMCSHLQGAPILVLVQILVINLIVFISNTEDYDIKDSLTKIFLFPAEQILTDLVVFFRAYWQFVAK
jgi:hypothetical protein